MREWRSGLALAALPLLAFALGAAPACGPMAAPIPTSTAVVPAVSTAPPASAPSTATLSTTTRTAMATATTGPSATPATGPSSTPTGTPRSSATPPGVPTGLPRTTAAPAAGNVGYLEGHASIGPLTPVERVGVPTPTPPPAVCTSRGLAIYQADGTTPVTSFDLQPDCTYRVALGPGSYLVKLKQQPALGGSKELPRSVTIESGKTVRLDFSVDTGIR